jgi:hypothetical protein
MWSPRWSLAAAVLAAACGGSKPPPDDADGFQGERLSSEQNKNEVDPFFEGDSNRGTQKVDLQDEESRSDESSDDDGDGDPEAE